MKWTKTIRFRFTLWATLLLLSMLAAFGGFVYINLSHSLHTAIDDTLSLSANQTAAGLNVENEKILIPEAISGDETGSDAFSESGLTLIVLSADGSVLEAIGPYHSYPIKASVLSSQTGFLTLPKSEETDAIRIYTLPVLDNGQVAGWVLAMQSLGNVQDSLDRLLAALLLGGGLLSIVAALAGYFLAARALAPIDSIARAARRISTEDLSARLNLPNTGDEVSRLATTFDEMLTRLEGGFQRERQFTSDASHELRTPLAAMQAILSLVREGERSVQEYRQALDDLAGETERMRGLAEDLLALARYEGGFKLNLETINLSILLSDVADSLRPLAQAKGLALACYLPPGLITRGDADQLIRLFVNLLDNAIKYTQKGAITVSAVRTEQSICVSIADTGIGISLEHLPHIFKRFYQVEISRSSAGSGLGLAIALQIARAHGGRIEVQSTLGVGTTLKVVLPIILA